MKISRIEVDRLSIRLPQPLTISFHTWVYQDNFFVRLHSADGHVGWGEAAPFKPITGDAAEEVVAEVRNFTPATLPEFHTTEEFYDNFAGTLSCPTLRAAFDLAAHDLIARQQGKPVYRLYRPTPRSVPNCVTVFIKEDAARTQAEARRILSTYPHLRLLKIKLKGEEDVERCAAIRAVTPPHLRFVIDANQGFADPDRAVAELNRILDVLGDVVAIEEPCPKGEHRMTRRIKERLGRSTIFADESCATEADLEAIIRERSAGGINLKLQKAGGITPGKRMARRAAAAGMTVMLGSMFEDALATSSGVHFAASTDNVVLTDLDMDLDLPTLWTGKTAFRDGARLPLEEPGFGFQLDLERIARAPTDTVKLQTILAAE